VAPAPEGGKRALRWKRYDANIGLSHGNDPGDRPVAVGDLDLGAVLHRPQMPGKLILQLGDLHALHGHI
jgi:hypothetical protein